MAFSGISTALVGACCGELDARTNLAFTSSTPPVVQPNTRIIALCGFRDWYTQAAPKSEGCLYSDFYLFYNLFRGLGAAQRWLTCDNPDFLAAKHGQYTHGEANGDRRVVLDKGMVASGLKIGGDIRVIPPKDLLQSFISYFASECQAAAENNQPILLLVFGHGELKISGVAVGGVGNPRSAPRLRSEHLKLAMQGLNITISLLTSTHFSGGWLIQPNINPISQPSVSDITKSHLREANLGSAYHGSVWTTSVMDLLIELENEKASKSSSNSTVNDSAESGGDGDTEKFAYAGLAQAIITALRMGFGSRGPHQVSFAARDDWWAEEWRQSSGISLARFREQWELLPKASSQLEGASSSVKDLATAEYDTAFGIKLTPRYADAVVAEVCLRYLNSCPPVPESNEGEDAIAFRAAEHYLNGRKTQFKLSREQTHEILTYRLDATELATTFKDLTLSRNQTFAPCHLFRYEDWIEDPMTVTTHEYCESILEQVSAACLLETPSVQGSPFLKFDRYLAACYADNGFTNAQVDTAIQTMQVYKQVQIRAVTEQISRNGGVKTALREGYRVVQDRRSSSLSPRDEDGDTLMEE